MATSKNNPDDTSEGESISQKSHEFPEDPDEQEFVVKALDEIYRVAENVSAIEMEIHGCSSEDYGRLDEMLLQQILTLDAVDPKGQERVKEERRRVVRYVQECMKLLDVKSGKSEHNKDEI